jgi:hypothetical protein
MPNSRMIVLTALAAATFTGGLFAQERAGQVLWSMGKVERVGPDGAATPLAKGEGVFEGDVIRSAAGSHAQILMRDEALIAVRPESSLRLETYAYQGREDGTERAVVELIKGGMRSITGAVGRTNKDSYQLRTRMILIGIRGTDHETFASDAGTYNRVTVGGTYLQGPDGRLDLAPGEVGFASLTPGMAPLRLDRTPEVMHLSMTANGNTGPQLRQASPSDGRRLEKGLPHARLPESMPVLPAQALGENTGKGWGKGGRCEGSCGDPLKSQGRGNGKGRP